VAAVAFLASSCFDAHQVDPGSLVVDNFDDGAFPVDATFTPWMCHSFNPSTNQDFSCAFDGDTLDGSAHSLRLDFKVTDPLDNVLQYPGVGLVTYGAAGLFRDVTAFSTLWFDAEIESGNPPLPSDAQLQVELGCSTVRLTDGSEPGDVYLLQEAVHSSQWTQIPLSISNFSSPVKDTRRLEGGVAGCLARVDQIGFVVESQLPDGQSGAGTLKIDNVSLK
jgi:hypothetical protein